MKSKKLIIMKHKILLVLSFILLLILAGWYLYPQQQEDEDVITLLSFNDFHGAYVSSKNNPGAARFVDAILAEKEKNPNVLILSGGDNISGSYFARITRGEPNETFTTIGNKLISVVGNHEFDWSKSYLVDTATTVMTYLTANIRDTVAGSKFNNRIKPYKIVEIPIFGDSGQNLSVGIIGITTKVFPADPSSLENLKYHVPNAKYVQLYCDTLKNKSVDMIVLLMHIGTKMEDQKAVIMEDNVKDLANLSDIDAIISAHSHNIVLGETASGAPIIQAGTNGQYIGKLKFSVTKNNNQSLSVKYISGDTIKVSTKGATNKIVEDAVKKLIDTHGFNDNYAESLSDLIHDRSKNLYSYTEVGALVTASYVAAYNKFNPKDTRPVIGLNHFKGIRTGLNMGPITKLQAGNVLPFGGDLKGYEISGKDLKELILSGTDMENTRGFLQSSNIIINTFPDRSTKHCDLFITYANGDRKEIKDDTDCVFVCGSYIATGGDGYEERFFMNEIKGFKIETTTAFLSYLKEQEIIPNNNARLPQLSRVK